MPGLPMEELQLSLTVARTDQRNFGVWLRSWQVGHILQALVVDKGPSGDLILRVAGQQITATADFPVQKGAQLLLQIASLSPTPVLKLLKMDNAPRSVANDTYNEQVQALLPRQASVDTPLAQLAKILASDKNLTFSASQRQTLLPLLEAIVTPLSQLGNPQSLREAFRRSGLWPQEDPLTQTVDLKTLLSRLLAQLTTYATSRPDGKSAEQDRGAEETDISQLRQSVEGALARITLHQLGAVKAAEQGLRQWLIEIPLLADGQYSLLQVSVSREKQQRKGSGVEPATPGWQVELRLESSPWGSLQVDVFVRGETVSATFYTATRQTVERLNESLPVLQSRLQALGLAVPALVCQQGEKRQSDQRLFTDPVLTETI